MPHAHASLLIDPWSVRPLRGGMAARSYGVSAAVQWMRGIQLLAHFQGAWLVTSPGTMLMHFFDVFPTPPGTMLRVDAVFRTRTSGGC